MFSSRQFDESLLKRFMVQYPAGEFLFKQNERGNTVFIILEGKVQLTHKVHHQERLVSIMEEGEVLGEKSLCSVGAYRRSFTAMAMTDVSLLEFTLADVKLIQSKVPFLFEEVLNLVIRRLDKANALVSVLQLKDNAERLVHFILYLCEFFGKKTARGTEFFSNVRQIATQGCLDEPYADQCLKLLIKNKVLCRIPEGYVLPDEGALLNALQSLKERIASQAA